MNLYFKKFSGLSIMWILFCQGQSFAQCGVQVEISSIPGGQITPMIHADNTVFSANWYAYDYEWKLNGQVVSTGSSTMNQMQVNPFPTGFNEICATVFATDSITGDSCAAELCNVFQSTGRELFVELNVSSAGLTATASGFYMGGDPVSIPDLTIDWGDGTLPSSNTISDVHTYAAAGTYTICFSAMDWVSFSTATTCRKVQVDNGLTNMVVGTLPVPSSGCYPINLSGVSSSPPFTSGWAYIAGFAFFPPQTAITNGGPFSFVASPQTPIVPGQAVVKAELTDINPSIYPIDRVTTVFFDVCGVVPDTIRGTVFEDMDADGLLDSTETRIPNFGIYLAPSGGGPQNYSTVTDSNGVYSILAPNAGISVGILSLQNGYGITLPGASNYIIDAAASNVFPSYNFGIAPLNTTISGNVYLDINHDSTLNAPPDIVFGSATVRAENTINGLVYYENVNSTGNYTFKLPQGNYVITLEAFLLDSATFYPDTIFVNSTGGTFNNNNFGCYSPVAGNFGVRIDGGHEARPGFDYANFIELVNTGFDTLDGTLVFTFDPLLTASSVSPVNGIIDNVNHTVTWPTGTTPAATRKYFTVSYTIPVNTPLGTQLNFSAQVSVAPGYTDTYLTNNSDTYQVTVIGSFDPNDKHVDPAGQGSAGNVLHGDKLNYRIRFQNTGTASAINVIVQDELDPELDMNTFLMKRASHPYDLVIHGNTVTWKFMNIQLPDSNTNEPASHGFIEYSINALPGLPDGTEIENTAGIYFDFNAPVITNTTLNTLQTTLVGTEEVSESMGIVIYPNPAMEQLHVETDDRQTGDVTIDLFDVQGRLVSNLYKGIGNGILREVYDIHTLPPGSYVVRFSGANGIARARFVKL